MENEKPPLSEKAQKAFRAAIEALPRLTRIPGATYRLQFNHRFTFAAAKRIIPYLADLGITDCYSSPFCLANKGSLHGYDVLDPQRLNPEIGTERDFEEFTKELERHGMGQLLDIVPNHMSIAGNENRWWMDVLENGPSSLYAGYFDIDWKPVKAELQNKVLLPILGDQYGRVLENQELQVQFDEGGFFVRYFERRLPLDPYSYRKILMLRIDELKTRVGEDRPELQELLSILTALEHLPPRTERNHEKIMERQREKEVIKRRLWNLYGEQEEIRSFIDSTLLLLKGEKGKPRSFDLLDAILNEQAYRLSHWRVATEEINFRRFFDINDLAAIRIENLEVFREIHKLVFKLVREGKVTGLRVDHPDGLFNPVEYFYRLQRSAFVQFCLSLGEQGAVDPAHCDELARAYDDEMLKNPRSPLRTPFYVVGEKILTKGERIPEDWPVHGTVGYVFLNPLTGIFVDTLNAKAFDRIYSQFTRFRVIFTDLVYEKKKFIMQTSMASEVNMLGYYLNRLSEKDRYTRDFTLNSLTRAIVETIACFPVYRTYVNPCGVIERDRRYGEQTIARAKRKATGLDPTVFDFLESVLLLRFPAALQESDRQEWLDFAMRFQQMTGPVMAKGLEDTVFYIYNRLAALNEVGGNPERFGTTVDAFHGVNIERMKSWPHELSATTTHDTKRSEDVRARIAVLSEIPAEWREALIHWSRLNRGKKTVLNGYAAPNRNEEYLLYQTLLGAWPLQPMDQGGRAAFTARIKEYMVKAMRESKVNTSWISSDPSYEDAVLKFVDAILSDTHDKTFLDEIQQFQRRISYLGMFNSLSQIVVKITSPGVPDFYQGTELWDLSLVDPDNRRPVDYDLRRERLAEVKQRMAAAGPDLTSFAADLLSKWSDGSIKLYVTLVSLLHRKRHRQLFMTGTYVPLNPDGDHQDHVFAFARENGEEVVLVIVPRMLSGIVKGPNDVPLGEAWGDSSVLLPEGVPGERFSHLFTGASLEVREKNGGRSIRLSDAFAHFPAAVLKRK